MRAKTIPIIAVCFLSGCQPSLFNEIPLLPGQQSNDGRRPNNPVKGCLGDRFVKLQPSSAPTVRINLDRVQYTDANENQWTYTKRMCTSFWNYWRPFLPQGMTQADCQQRQQELLDQNKMGQAIGTNPHPVYFRTSIQSANPIVEYAWDFGDPNGSLPNTSVAPEAAHLYERPGVYTVNLKIVDQAGNEARAQTTITVVDRNTLGQKYYVDAANGNDANNGLSPTTAWRTAAFAFRNALVNQPIALAPHSQILFRRGQEHLIDTCAENLTSGHYTGMIGRYFGAYGTGANPVIRASNTSHGCKLFDVWGWDHGHIAFEDLDFDLQSAAGYRAGFVTTSGNLVNLIFNRVHVQRVAHGLVVGEVLDTINGKTISYPAEGIYFVQSRIFDSDIYRLTLDPAWERDGVMMGGAGEKWGIIDSTLEKSGNHCLYLYARHVVVDYLKAIKPSFGRTGMRGRSERPGFSGYYNVTNSEFLGWIDDLPRQNGGGKDYNWSMVEFTAAGPDDQIVEHVFFARNKATNAQTLLRVGNAENIYVCENQFETSDTSSNTMVEFGNQQAGYQNLANKNVRLAGNTFAQLTSGRPGDFIFISNMSKNPFPGPSPIHENFEVLRNRFVFQPGYSGQIIDMNRSQPNGLPDMTQQQAEDYWKREFLIRENIFQSSSRAEKLIGTGGGSFYTIDSAVAAGLLDLSNLFAP